MDRINELKLKLAKAEREKAFNSVVNAIGGKVDSVLESVKSSLSVTDSKIDTVDSKVSKISEDTKLIDSKVDEISKVVIDINK